MLVAAAAYFAIVVIRPKSGVDAPRSMLLEQSICRDEQHQLQDFVSDIRRMSVAMIEGSREENGRRCSETACLIGALGE